MGKNIFSATLMALCLAVNAYSQTMDSELSLFAEKISKQVSTSGKKKIAIVDFVDLSGKPTELGKFFAEQFSVSIVEQNREFSVVDRANINTILKEHRMTVDGLVNPDNAKKLGKFSDVDALVIGTIANLDGELLITAKVIDISSAEIVGASKAKFTLGKEFARIIKEDSVANNAIEPDAKISKSILDKRGSLTVVFENYKLLDNNHILLSYVVKNESMVSDIAVGLIYTSIFGGSFPISASLTSDNGVEYQATGEQLRGLRGITSDPRDLTAVEKGKEVKVAVKFVSKNGNARVPLKSFRFQADFVVDYNYLENAYSGGYDDRRNEYIKRCKSVNIVLDFPIN